MALENIFYSDSPNGILDKGSNKPSWRLDTSPWISTNKNDWYSSNQNIDYFYNLQKIQDSDLIKSFRMWFQYGENSSGWASARFIFYDILITNIDEQSNGDYIVAIEFSNFEWRSRITDYLIAGVKYESVIKIGDSEIFNISNGNTGTEINLQNATKVKKTIRIKPQQTSTDIILKMNTVYPNGEYPPSESEFGFALKNTNPPNYIPCLIRKTNFVKLNDTNRKILIRKNNNFSDVSQENLSTQNNVNTGHTRIRKNGNFQQVPLGN